MPARMEPESSQADAGCWRRVAHRADAGAWPPGHKSASERTSPSAAGMVDALVLWLALAGDEAVGHRKEVVEHLGSEVGEADEDAVVAEVVLWRVVKIG
jgi:hypothetical protein